MLQCDMVRWPRIAVPSIFPTDLPSSPVSLRLFVAPMTDCRRAPLARSVPERAVRREKPSAAVLKRSDPAWPGRTVQARRLDGGRYVSDPPFNQCGSIDATCHIA